MTNTPGTLGPDPDDLEAEVRRRLHAAVADVRPASDALDRLRVAVPARRRQRRVATLGAAGLAAALLIGTPVLRTVVDGGDGSKSNVGGIRSSSSAVNATEPLPGPSEGMSAGIPGGAGQSHPATRGGTPTSGSGASIAPTSGQSAGVGQTVPPATSAPPSGSTPPAKPTPACATTDLSGEDARLGPIGADGLAYGVLQVRSNAAKDCQVTGPGVVSVVSPPGNPIVQVTVLQHKAGDDAAALPVLPETSGTVIVLRPGQEYEFQFAWKPQAPGADGTCAADSPKASVPALGYALIANDFNVAKVTLTPTCGGTVYRTDIYRTGAYPRVG
ncbi:DUF4232 domain-containing protein [Embleya sp. NBC_00888]|uniref:DUF4232 domain-containing protein n=1 Tax=Embleya sp. NBC_00888 TaxID=2975960 RepID=UPI00386CDDE9|nr:DUF4232 domain-containing protein [Embleya sp. NBC_00888]